MNIEQSILNHIREVAGSSDVAITRDTGLLDTGLLDSINLVGLIQFIEEQFAIRIPDGDIGSELFMSPATLTAYVERRLAVGAGSEATA